MRPEVQANKKPITQCKLVIEALFSWLCALIGMGLLCYLCVPWLGIINGTPDPVPEYIPIQRPFSQNIEISEDTKAYIIPCGQTVTVRVFFDEITSIDMQWSGSNANISIEGIGSLAADVKHQTITWDYYIYDDFGKSDAIRPWFEASFKADEKLVGKGLEVSASMDIIYPYALGAFYENRTVNASCTGNVFVVSQTDYSLLERNDEIANNDYRILIWVVPAFFILPEVCFVWGGFQLLKKSRLIKKSNITNDDPHNGQK